ncbi:hypothetical protein PsYK624_074170 [Phanerochaete sordida]|uniref:Uncharacterized protein n=1 Tax=Phanerochaete sordida TaxID=48140 RepID=A0A9P3GAD8_9APHY|nr:hypothetical protein PsYK624_074170 [Phanerochaete sordida]
MSLRERHHSQCARHRFRRTPFFAPTPFSCPVRPSDGRARRFSPASSAKCVRARCRASPRLLRQAHAQPRRCGPPRHPRRRPLAAATSRQCDSGVLRRGSPRSLLRRVFPAARSLGRTRARAGVGCVQCPRAHDARTSSPPRIAVTCSW